MTGYCKRGLCIIRFFNSKFVLVIGEDTCYSMCEIEVSHC